MCLCFSMCAYVGLCSVFVRMTGGGEVCHVYLYPCVHILDANVCLCECVCMYVCVCSVPR